MNDKLTTILSSNLSHSIKQCINHSREQKIKKATQDIVNIINQANQLLDQYDELMNRKSDYDRLIVDLNAGRGHNIDEIEKMINDVFFNNPSIQDVCIDG